MNDALRMLQAEWSFDSTAHMDHLQAIWRIFISWRTEVKPFFSFYFNENKDWDGKKSLTIFPGDTAGMICQFGH